KQGKGAFVKTKPIKMNPDLNHYQGFYESLIEQGLDVKAILLKHDKIVPPENVSDILGCTKTDKVNRFSRLFSVKDLPIAYFVTFFNKGINFSNEQIEKIKKEPVIVRIRRELQIP